MKLALLRAATKETVVVYKGQRVMNDGPYEDAETSSDFWTVFADRLLTGGWYDEVELWYQENDSHRPGVFTHDSGLREVFWKRGFTNVPPVALPDVLFVRGKHVDYDPLFINVLKERPRPFVVYYPSGPYYCPPTHYRADFCFVEDVRHVAPVMHKRNVPVELFKKSAVDKYFRARSTEKKWDMAFVCCAPIADRKRLDRFRQVLVDMRDLEYNHNAVVIGMQSESLVEGFKSDKLDVTFTGWLPRVKMTDVLSHCRLGVVLSSADHDGCPRVIQEFLANGLPVVVSDFTCCSTIYVNNATGEVVKDADLAQGITDILAVSQFYDIDEFFTTNLSMGCSVRHFIEHMRHNGGPVK